MQKKYDKESLMKGATFELKTFILQKIVCKK
jgi:hypothetical protein